MYKGVTRGLSRVEQLQDVMKEETLRHASLAVIELDVRVGVGNALQFVGMVVVVRAAVAPNCVVSASTASTA